jgi:hypothetical protein
MIIWFILAFIAILLGFYIKFREKIHTWIKQHKKELITFIFGGILVGGLAIPILLETTPPPIPDDPIDPGLVITGLQFEDVDIFWNNTGATLSNSYTDVFLSAKEIFVPDALHNATEHFEYYLQEWHEDQARFWVTLTYFEHTFYDYENIHIGNILGNLPQQDPISFDDAIDFIVYDPWNPIIQLFNPGDIVLYMDEYYLCKQQVYNYNGLPSNLPQYWELVEEESEGSIFPSNRFQISNKEVWATNSTERGYICNVTEFKDINPTFNVSWGINISYHYYHIIIDYYLYFENSTGTYLVHEFKDVYSGERPDLLIVSYDVYKYYDKDLENFVDEAVLRYDNLYGDALQTNVTIAYHINKTDEYISFDSSSEEFNELPEDLYDIIVTRANEINRTETLLSNPNDYVFKSFSVNITENSRDKLSFKILSEYNEFNLMGMWAMGSPLGGGKGSSTDWQTFSSEEGSWTDPDNMQTNDTTNAIGNANWHDFYEFKISFEEEDPTILGIEVQVVATSDPRSKGPLEVSLSQDGGDSWIEETQEYTFPDEDGMGGTRETHIYGGTDDLWDEEWVDEYFEDENFTVRLTAEAYNYVYYLAVRITYSDAPTPTPPEPPTNFDATTYSNYNQINLTWTKGSGATHTYIESYNDSVGWKNFDTSAGGWANTHYAIDNKTNTCAATSNINDFLYVNTSLAESSDKIRIYCAAFEGPADADIVIHAYYNDAWNVINEEALIPHSQFVEFSLGGVRSISSLRLRASSVPFFGSVRVYSVQYNSVYGRGLGNEIYNGTGTSYNHGELEPGIHGFGVWSYNSTTGLWNETYVSDFSEVKYFAGGDGSVGDPYQITNWYNLHNIRHNLSQSFILNNNLDSSSTGYNTYANLSANSEKGWTPIGTVVANFVGDFNGDNNTISDLVVNRSTDDYVGLFCLVSGGSIKNVGVTNVDILGDDYVGGIAGDLVISSIVTNSYITGNIEGDEYVGGLVGRISASTITDSYSNCSVSGKVYVGGFSGLVTVSSTINNTYVHGSVSRLSGSNAFFGGFSARNYQSDIKNSYSTASVHYVGAKDPTNRGFCGAMTVGGGFHMSGNFWDKDASGQLTTGCLATGKSTSEMKYLSTFANAGWDIVYSTTDLNNGYPYLSWQNETSEATWLILETEEPDIPPEPPTDLTATTVDHEQIDLTWTQGVNATHTLIEWDNSATWSRGDGNEIYNGTGVSHSHTGLDPDTTYYYQAWSYNSTSGLWNETYASDSATTDPDLEYYELIIRNDGIDYFVWLGSNTSAYHVAQHIENFNGANEYISVWKNDTFCMINELWQPYYGDASGTNWTINTFDVIKVYLDGVGTQVINMTGNNEMNYSANRNQTLNNNVTLGKGYNYVAWLKEDSTSLSLINSTVGLEWDDMYSKRVSLWNQTTYTYNNWFAGWSFNDKNVHQWNVLAFRIGSNTKYLDTEDF